MSPGATTALAVAASDDALADAWVGLLDRAGVRAYRIDDAPGLVVCRILSMIANEAWEAVSHGVASRADVDAAMVYGTDCPDWDPSNGVPGGRRERLRRS